MYIIMYTYRDSNELNAYNNRETWKWISLF